MADVVQAQPQARMKLQKNSGVLLYQQEFAPDPSTYTQHVGQAISIGPAASATLSIGGITAVRNLLLQSDVKCTVKLNGSVTGIPLVGTNMVFACYSGSITQIVVDNNSTTDTATVQYVVSD